MMSIDSLNVQNVTQDISGSTTLMRQEENVLLVVISMNLVRSVKTEEVKECVCNVSK